jgi:hypothetical protein
MGINPCNVKVNGIAKRQKVKNPRNREALFD